MEKLRSAYARWHHFYRRPETKRELTNESLFPAIWLWVIYNLVVTLTIWLASCANMLATSGNRWAVCALLLSVVPAFTSGYWINHFYQMRLFTDKAPKRAARQYIADCLRVVSISIELFVAWAIVGQLTNSKIGTPTGTGLSSSILYFGVLLFFVLGEPVFEGYLIRGYFTRLLEKTPLKDAHWRVVVHFWLPVVVGAVFHTGLNFQPSVLIFALVQATAFQLLAEKEGLKNSIAVNMFFNLLLVLIL